MIGTSLGPYKIIEQLGAGGMGEVYLGEDTRLGRKVAIKRLPAEFASERGLTGSKNLFRYSRTTMTQAEFREFVEIARFDSRLEAEAIGHALDQFDIPFFVQSHDIGMFGPGHMGRTPGGAGLCVPADKAEEASELLRCAVRGEDEDGEEDGQEEDGGAS